MPVWSSTWPVGVLLDVERQLQIPLLPAVGRNDIPELDSCRLRRHPHLAAPMQFYWSAERMFAGAIEARLLQCEIPLCRLVSIVDQHEAGIVLQTLCLLDHRLLILAHKFCAEELRNRRQERNVVE